MIGIRIRVLQFNGDEAGAQKYPAIGLNSLGGGRPPDVTVFLLRMSRFLDYGRNQKNLQFLPLNRNPCYTLSVAG
jgi:hypothetical protein